MEEKLNLNSFTFTLGVVKCVHWMTKKHSYHKILDDLYDELYDSFDEFVESYIGKFKDGFYVGEIEMSERERYSSFDSVEDVSETLKDFCRYLKPFSEKDSELSSIFDDIKNSINKALYLLRMD